MDGFPEKLSLVLKALAISRGRLAADLAVDKSVVARWLSGKSLPSGENLAHLTRLVAARHAGFTGLDWEGDLASLSLRLGVSLAPAAPRPVAPAPLEAFALDARVGKGAFAAGALAADITGFWRTTVPAVGEPGRFLQSHSMLKVVDGAIAIDTMLFGGHGRGWAIAAGNQVYMGVSFQEAFGLVFMVMNGLDRPASGLMDGIFSGCLPGLGGTVVATPAVSEKLSPLSGDEAADGETLATLGAGMEMLTAAEVPAAHLARLRQGADRAAGELALVMPSATSLSRAPRLPAASPPRLKIVGP